MSQNEPRPAGDFFRSFQTEQESSRENTFENDSRIHFDGWSEEADSFSEDALSIDEEILGKPRSDSSSEEPGVRAEGDTSQASMPSPLDLHEPASVDVQESVDDIGRPGDVSEPAKQQSLETSEAPSETKDSRAEEQSSPDGRMDLVNQKMTELMTSIGAVSTEVRELRKLYHQEFAGRLQNLQREVDRNREIESGRIFDGILGSLARLYHEYENNSVDLEDIKAKKLFGYMLDDIADILGTNNVQIQKSKPGDKRVPRHSQIADKVPTEDPALHDTVIQSRGTGFHIENRTLIREIVDIYLYTATSGETPIQN